MSTKLQDSTFDADDFHPREHVTTVERDAAATVGGYIFSQDAIVGMPDLPDNSRAGFRQDASETPFNFETDLELFQALPWAEGYAVSIPFYDPGLEPPRRYVFRTEGTAVIRGPNGAPIECWLVTGDYNTGRVVKRFWIAKANQVVIREQAEADGAIYIKTLLLEEAPAMSLPTS